MSCCCVPACDPAEQPNCCSTPLYRVGWAGDRPGAPSFPSLTFTVDEATEVANLAADISRLDDCDIVFAGFMYATCHYSLFDAGDWPSVATWVSAGGRLVVAGEYGDRPVGLGGGFCMSSANRTLFNSFLSAVGSTMVFDNNFGEDGCNPSNLGIRPSNPPARITRLDLDPGAAFPETIQVFRLAATTSITGGDRWFNADMVVSAKPTVVAGEQVGDGLVVAIGDGNTIWSCASSYAVANCVFFTRLAYMDIPDMFLRP